ncbi:Disintegrin and metalloproteinase domain-containing protein 12-like protein, partial [Leptotrombidium deliense]
MKNPELFVELVLVNDNKLFTDYKRNKAKLIEDNLRIANILNAFYKQLNIVIVVVDIIIWESRDLIKIEPISGDTLKSFEEYRLKLSTQIAHDNTQLITGNSFEKNVVGRGKLNSICHPRYSGAVNSYNKSDFPISFIAETIAHEMGHNFGMSHDIQGCCPRSSICVMQPTSILIPANLWSQCSKRDLNVALSNGKLECLKNNPKSSSHSICGNGVLEAGEECDCIDSLCSRCCDRQLCKLKPNAKCGTGSCCDFNRCEYFRECDVKMCRQAVNKCDLSEFCDGKSEFCPKDEFLHNGMSCRYGYCFDGQCKLNEQECRYHFGNSARQAIDSCYSLNSLGKVHGNCGYNERTEEFNKCENNNIKCGALHCSSESSNVQKTGSNIRVIVASSRIYNRNKKTFETCYTIVFSNAYNKTKPVLVENGVRCDVNKLCVNQQCLDVNYVINNKKCPKDCYNSGECGNDGK